MFTSALTAPQGCRIFGAAAIEHAELALVAAHDAQAVAGAGRKGAGRPVRSYARAAGRPAR